MDRPLAPAGAAEHTDPGDLRRLRRLRFPCAGGAVRKLETAVSHRVDRADVLASLGHWSGLQGHADRHPCPDRLRGAGGISRKERDPDRGVRATAPGRGWRYTRRGGDTGRKNALASDLDDLVRFYSRRSAAHP